MEFRGYPNEKKKLVYIEDEGAYNGKVFYDGQNKTVKQLKTTKTVYKIKYVIKLKYKKINFKK